MRVISLCLVSQSKRFGVEIERSARWAKCVRAGKAGMCGKGRGWAGMGGRGRGELGEMCVNVVCVGIKALNTLLQCYRVKKYT
jgi:hypothetical protein